MFFGKRKSEKFSALIFLAMTALIFFWPQSKALAVGRQQLHGHMPNITKTAQMVGRLEGTRKIHLAIGLPLRNKEAREYLLKTLYDPKSPQYRHFLTVEKFAEMFGATQEDYQKVIDFAKSNNLTVTKTYPNRLLIDVSGTANDIQKALHVNLNNYNRPDGSTFYAPDREPSLDLDVPIQHISHLNDYAIPRRAGSQNNLPMNPLLLQKPIQIQPFNGTGPTGPLCPPGTVNNTYIGNDFRNAYFPGTTLTGSGQLVALVQFDGFYNNDIIDYANLTGLTVPNLVTYTFDGFSGSPCGSECSNWTLQNEVEVALDIDMTLSMATGLSNIYLYEGSPISFIPVHVLNQIALDNTAKQISSSWSWEETTDTNIANIFEEYALQGQSFFQAAGDLGAYTPMDPVSIVPEPICETNLMTVVGGTILKTSGTGTNGTPTPVGTYVSETT